jgi:hypothetical protein
MPKGEPIMKVTIYKIIRTSDLQECSILYTKYEAEKALQGLIGENKQDWLQLKEELGEDIDDFESEYYIEKKVIEGSKKDVVRSLICTGISYAGGHIDNDELNTWYYYERRTNEARTT